MCCRIIELRDKQVVSLKDGCVIGYVCDVEIDTECGKLTAIIVVGKSKGFSILGRNEEFVIPWSCIEVIGNDSILVNFEISLQKERKRKSAFSGLFYGD